MFMNEQQTPHGACFVLSINSSGAIDCFRAADALILLAERAGARMWMPMDHMWAATCLWVKY